VHNERFGMMGNQKMENASLFRRAVRRLVTTLTFIAVLLFLPAGSLRFWPGWAYLALMVAFGVFSFTNLLKHDPQLLERRLQRKEAQPEQRLFQKLWTVILVVGMMLPGFDYRFGWSSAWLRPVPLWLIVAGQAVAVAGNWMVFRVMKANSFAASVIQVEAEQKVISSGPYAIVRHPMYSGMLVTMLATPLALGSYVALPVFALMIPVLVFRLTYEEKVLRRELAGYAEYCERTRFRIVPFVW